MLTSETESSIFSPSNPDNTRYPYIMKTVYLLRGLPGSGKTTLAKTLEATLPNAIAMATDDFFVDQFGNYNFDPSKLKANHDRCFRRFQHFLEDSNQTNIIVHNTFTTERELEPYLFAACAWGAKIVSLVVENRHGNVSTHGVPTETVNRMNDRFEFKLRPTEEIL